MPWVCCGFGNVLLYIFSVSNVFCIRALWTTAQTVECLRRRWKKCSQRRSLGARSLFPSTSMISAFWRSFFKKFANVVLFSQGGSGNQFVEQLFRVFDKNGDGGIDFNVCSQAKLIFKWRHNFNRNSSLRRTCAAQMILRRNLGERVTYKT